MGAMQTFHARAMADGKGLPLKSNFGRKKILTSPYDNLLPSYEFSSFV